MKLLLESNWCCIVTVIKREGRFLEISNKKATSLLQQLETEELSNIRIVVRGCTRLDAQESEIDKNWIGYEFDGGSFLDLSLRDWIPSEESLKRKICLTGPITLVKDEATSALLVTTEFLVSQPLSDLESQRLLHRTEGAWLDGVGQDLVEYFEQDFDVEIELVPADTNMHLLSFGPESQPEKVDMRFDVAWDE